MATSIVVRKSAQIVVRPSELATTSGSGSIIKLSSFDKGFDKIFPTMLLAFEHPIHETAETIKRVLSQALVHYYPFAGRLVSAADTGDEATSHIQCSGDGVVFASASASCVLKEVKFSNDLSSASASARALLHELVPYPNDHGCGGSPADRPLLLMQVTEFSCSGFVLGVTWNHGVADATGMGQFLQAIGDLARGLPSPTVVPVRSVDSLPRVPANKVLPLELLIPHIVPFSNLAYLDITVPSRLVDCIKGEFSIRFNGQACSVFDIVSALIWHCHTRAAMSDPDTPALFLFIANVRKHVGLTKAYYGNCITTEIVRAKSGTVAHGDIIDLVNLINHSKEKIGDDLFMDKTASSCQQQSAGLQVPYNLLSISSWRNLGIDEADFVSGRPTRVGHLLKDGPSFPVCVLLPECLGKVEATTLSAKVKEEHAEAFLRELASFS